MINLDNELQVIIKRIEIIEKFVKKMDLKCFK